MSVGTGFAVALSYLPKVDVPACPDINPDDLFDEKELFSSTHGGVVLRAQLLLNDLAVQRVIRKTYPESMRRFMDNEIYVASRLGTSGIGMELIGKCGYSLVFREAIEGDMYTNAFIDPSDFDTRVKWAKEMVRLVRQLHQLGLSHGDVSPENFVLDGNCLRLIDFAVAMDIRLPRESFCKHTYSSPTALSLTGPYDAVVADLYCVAYCGLSMILRAGLYDSSNPDSRTRFLRNPRRYVEMWLARQGFAARIPEISGFVEILADLLQERPVDWAAVGPVLS
jgi:serine/threonine protein kinase